MGGLMTASGMGGMMPRKGKKKGLKPTGGGLMNTGGFVPNVKMPASKPARTPAPPKQDRAAMMKETQKKLLNASYGPNYKPFG